MVLSTSLLDDVVRDALDPAYAQAVVRCPSAPRPRGRGWPVGAVLLVAGLLFGVAVTQLHLHAPARRVAHAVLLGQVTRAATVLRALESQERSRRSALAGLRVQQLAATAAGAAALQRLAALQLAAGVRAVNGPGISLTLTDAASPRLAGRVNDRDLQEVVNVLWGGGAEAVAIDGVRLGSTTAIRAAGAAVLVAFRPVSSPYRVDAVGPPDRLETAFVSSATGQRLHTAAAVYGLRVAVRRAAQLSLVGAVAPHLRYAVAVPGGRS